MTPEQLAGLKYCGRQADLFSSGVVLFMMLTQCQPFQKAATNDHFYRYIAGNRPDKFWNEYKSVSPFSKELKDLLTGMFQLNPDARLTLEEIKNHPWIHGITPTYE